ncbi:MAG: 3-methylcrotonyl-CoA carboxylase, partial [Gammaproteobacteria bacterium]|nr:3-methylcrotonyl-CoA carboxylase [Gammaproteobacteria bacterium]
MFKRILIANRGEIACRIIESCRRLGVETVAVYSEADRSARHVRLADRALWIGPAEASASYLRAERIIEAARTAGVDAVHPGYGFLSENADFARALADSGIVLIGPKPETIEAMGSKARAKAIMGAAGVPLVPGYHGDDQSDATLVAEAAR